MSNATATTDVPFTFTGRMRSFRHAFAGIRLMLATQHNAWLHGVATIAVCITSAALRISRIEWCAIVVAIVAVWTAEAINTAFEFLCDVASPQFHPAVKNAKDVAAGAVLLAAIGAAVIGLLVLGPHITMLLKSPR